MSETKLYRVELQIDYIDSISERTFFQSLDKKKAIDFANKKFKEVNTTICENNPSQRPNLMEFKDLISAIAKNHRPCGYMPHNVWVEESSFDVEITRDNVKTVWQPSLDDALALFRSDLAYLMAIDLNITLTDEELFELQDLFIANPESFREGNYFGIIKHGSELLKMMNAEKLEEDMMPLEKNAK